MTGMDLNGDLYSFNGTQDSSDLEDRNGGGTYDSFYSPSNDYFYSNSPYANLDHTRRKIRLLRLLPRKTVAEHFKDNARWDRKHARALRAEARVLACEIEETALSRVDGGYSTLSYCAGDPEETEVILVNGIPFNAFANLEHAIDRILNIWELNRPQSDILLWVDQICIDQSNKQERGEQVRFMREIYRRSHETFVCLSTPDVEDCLSWVPRVVQDTSPSRALRKISDSPGVMMFRNLLLDFLVGKHRGGDLRPSRPAKSSGSIPDSDDPPRSGPLLRSPQQTAAGELCHNTDRPQIPTGLMKMLQVSTTSPGHQQRFRSLNTNSTETSESNPITSEVFQDSLRKFLTNNWWRRSWVYQEFLSANIVYFISGPQIVSWPELSPLVDFISNGLDQFMESIRLYFDSMITEEMKEKEKERRVREKEMERVAAAKRHVREEKERRDRLERKKKRYRERLEAHSQKVLDFHKEKEKKMKILLEEQASVTKNFLSEQKQKEEVLEKERENWTRLLQERRNRKVNELQEMRELRIKGIQSRRHDQLRDIDEEVQIYKSRLDLLEKDEEERKAEVEYQKLLHEYQIEMEEFEAKRLLEWKEEKQKQEQAEQDEENLHREKLEQERGNIRKQILATNGLNFIQKAVLKSQLKSLTSTRGHHPRQIPSDPSFFESQTLVRPTAPPIPPSMQSLTSVEQLRRESPWFNYEHRAVFVEEYRKRIFELAEKRQRIEQDAKRQVASAEEDMKRQLPPEIVITDVKLNGKLESIEEYPPLHLIEQRIAELQQENAPNLDESEDEEEEVEAVRQSEQPMSRKPVSRKTSSERQDTHSEKLELGAHEIQQKDKITALQAQFRQIDRSAIESMAKGKRNFKRAADLKALLRHSRNCEASDPRDRVYAFLGMANRGYDLVPDYSTNNTIKQVLIETAKSIIRFDKSLAILEHVHHGRDKLGSKLPTWVPDWTSRMTYIGLEMFTQNQTPSFDAAKDISFVLDFRDNPDYNDQVDLKAKGIRIDYLTHRPEFDEASSFLTEEGMLALTPRSARSEDEIWVLGGCKTAVLLRPETGDMYGYLGEVLLWDHETGAYSDVMFGHGIEAILQERSEEHKVEEIWII